MITFLWTCEGVHVLGAGWLPFEMDFENTHQFLTGFHDHHVAIVLLLYPSVKG